MTPPIRFDEWLRMQLGPRPVEPPPIQDARWPKGGVESVRELVLEALGKTRDFASYLPVVGDVIQLADAAGMAQQGHYGQAALGAGLAALPGVIGSVGRVPARFVPPSEEALEAAKAQIRELVQSRPPIPTPKGAQRISVMHSSPELYADVRVDKANQGKATGGTWEGPGYYTTDHGGVAEAYRETVAGESVHDIVTLSNGEKFDATAARNWLHEQKLNAELALYEAKNNGAMAETLTKLTAERDAISSRLRWVQQFRHPSNSFVTPQRRRDAALEQYLSARKLEPQSRDDAVKRKRQMQAGLKRFHSFEEQIRGPAVEPATVDQGVTYQFDLVARPDEMFTLHEPVAKQPKVRAALNQLRTAGGEPLGDALVKVQKHYQDDPEMLFESARAVVGQQNPDNPFRSPNSPIYTKHRPWTIMEQLQKHGIVANKYPGEESDMGEAFNYVVNSPDRLQMKDLWSFLGITGAGAAARAAAPKKKEGGT